jgi:hypothetical protein
MSERFKSLSKLPNQPAARLLAQANCKLQTQLEAPASASIETVLLELEGLKAYGDMLMVLACSLPPRERVWWSCLAARDIIPDPARLPPPLAASEAWVFNPNTDNRQAAADAINVAEVGDDTVHCASAVVWFDGTLGPADLAQFPAPAGAAEMSVFAMAIIAWCRDDVQMDAMGEVLVERALDIARGGSGNFAAPPMTVVEEDDDEDDDDDEEEVEEEEDEDEDDLEDEEDEEPEEDDDDADEDEDEDETADDAQPEKVT